MGTGVLTEEYSVLGGVLGWTRLCELSKNVKVYGVNRDPVLKCILYHARTTTLVAECRPFVSGITLDRLNTCCLFF